MKFKIITAALLSLGAAFSLHAQTLSAGDIVIGFRGPTATTLNLEVKAGSVSSLAADTTQTLIGNFNSALTTNLGLTNWATDSSAGTGHTGVFWGAAGTSSATQVYAGSIWDASTAGTLGVANSLATDWSAVPSVGTANTKISALYGAFNTATMVGDGISRTIAASNTASWSGNGTNTGSSAFSTFNPNNNGFTGVVAANIDTGTNYTALDLYQVQANSSTFLGTFALYTSTGGGYNVGDLTFTSFTAIPEPSTYAAILGVAVLGFAMLRRRTQSLVEA